MVIELQLVISRRGPPEDREKVLKSILGEGVGDKKRVWREQREFLIHDLFNPEVQAPARARRLHRYHVL
eukprot:symbB.v1.2.013514.t1/scaffold795.1/size259473/6